MLRLAMYLHPPDNKAAWLTGVQASTERKSGAATQK